MAVENQISQADLEEFAKDWYRKLDVHAPLEDFRPLIAEDVELVFPEATVKGFNGYKGWYETVIGLFFDEVHTVKRVEPGSQEGEVKVVVRWEASVWKPPAANSERIVLDAYQTWIVQRSAKTDKPEIVRYVVDSLEYAPGSAKL